VFDPKARAIGYFSVASAQPVLLEYVPWQARELAKYQSTNQFFLPPQMPWGRPGSLTFRWVVAPGRGQYYPWDRRAGSNPGYDSILRGFR